MLPRSMVEDAAATRCAFQRRRAVRPGRSRATESVGHGQARASGCKHMRASQQSVAAAIEPMAPFVRSLEGFVRVPPQQAVCRVGSLAGFEQRIARSLLLAQWLRASVRLRSTKTPSLWVCRPLVFSPDEINSPSGESSSAEGLTTPYGNPLRSSGLSVWTRHIGIVSPKSRPM